MEAILIGHDLLGYVDGSLPAPPPTTTINNTAIPNPAYVIWLRQDKLHFCALLGTLSPTLLPLVSQVITSKHLWNMLAKTNPTPYHGHIKQLKSQLRKANKGSRSITNYTQSTKAIDDQLSLLGKPLEHEDIVERIREGLDSDYTSIKEAVKGLETTIFCEELLEKIINRKLSIQEEQDSKDTLPLTAFAVQSRHNPRYLPSSRFPNLLLLPTPPSSNSPPPKPFLGKYQWCRAQGHVVAACPLFLQRFPNVTPSSNSPPCTNQLSQPQARTSQLNLSSSNSQ